MSAEEIIKMIKKLPPEERAEVTAFVQAANAAQTVEESAVQYLPHAEAERRARNIFRENEKLFRRLAQ